MIVNLSLTDLTRLHAAFREDAQVWREYGNKKCAELAECDATRIKLLFEEKLKEHETRMERYRIRRLRP